MKPEINDPRIDAAIDSYPLVELPKGFTARTLSKIGKQRKYIPFRLHFIDLALPVFTSLFILLVIGVGWWIVRQFDPHWVNYLNLEINYALKGILRSTWWMDEVVIQISSFSVMLGAMIVIWVANRPRKVHHVN